MTNLPKGIRAVVAGAILAAGCAVASADNYPSRPITMIVPFPPGASTDFAARLLAEQMKDSLGQPVIIENRAGAGGTVGTALVARAAPDGYTVLLTVNAPITMNKFFQKDYPIDPRTALTPVINVGTVSLFLAVNAALPVKNVGELIDYAKARPGKVNFGSAGIGSAHQVAGELINKKAGTQMVHVPYRGGGPAIQDLVAGHIPVSFGTGPAVIPQAKAGTIRILAAVEERRDPELPDVPTVAETIPGVVTATWVGMFVPAGTPAEIVAKLNKAANEALQRQEVVAKMGLQGMRAAGGTPPAFKQVVLAEYAQFEKLIPELGISPE